MSTTVTRPRWRHWYVEAVVAVAVLLLLVGAVLASTGNGRGALLAAAPWWVTVLAVVSTTVVVPRRTGLVDALWVGATVVGAVVAAGEGQGWGALASTAVAALLGYQRVFARQHRPQGPLEVGARLPDVPLAHTDGTRTSTGELVGTPHLLVFVRGSWCPFCVAQVRDLAAEYRELDRRGVRVAVVSPQPAEDTARLAARFDVPMTFLVDEAGAAMRELDLVQAGGTPATFSADAAGDTVVPTVVLVDAAGVVRWLHHATDHRVRPAAPELLEVIDAVDGVVATPTEG